MNARRERDHGTNFGWLIHPTFSPTRLDVGLTATRTTLNTRSQTKVFRKGNMARNETFVPDADEQERLQRELQADIEELERDGIQFEQAFTELYFAQPQMEAWQ